MLSVSAGLYGRYLCICPLGVCVYALKCHRLFRYCLFTRFGTQRDFLYSYTYILHLLVHMGRVGFCSRAWALWTRENRPLDPLDIFLNSLFYLPNFSSCRIGISRITLYRGAQWQQLKRGFTYDGEVKVMMLRCFDHFLQRVTSRPQVRPTPQLQINIHFLAIPGSNTSLKMTSLLIVRHAETRAGAGYGRCFSYFAILKTKTKHQVLIVIYINFI